MTRTRSECANRPRGGGVVLLWQGAPEDAPGEEGLVLWQGAAHRTGVLSLTEYLDRHAEAIRRRYLAWAQDLGETRIMGRRLRERFIIAGDESLWTYSLFVELSKWNLRSMDRMLKVMAFELLLAERAPESVTFAGSDADLNRVLRGLCRHLRIGYQWIRLPRERSTARRPLRRMLPEVVRGLFAQAYFFLARLELPRPATPDSTDALRVLICTPFFNHNADQHDAREFTSRYWATLPRLLVQSGRRVHWLHLFYRHAKIPSARAAGEVLRRIQRDSAGSGSHSFVEAYVPLTAFLGIFGCWCRFVLESLLVGMQLRARFARNPCESFWPLLRSDWASAFRGVDCVISLVYAQSFDWALRSLPHQDEGILLMENQGWERSLARAWRVHRHGRLAGVPHSTIRFWDLRYHCDPRRYATQHRGFLPGPSVVILNGQAAKGEYLATSSVRENLVDCEALRYLHLRQGTPREVNRQGALRLLVLSDYLLESTDELLRLVGSAQRIVRAPLQVSVKPHPNCPISLRRYAGIELRVVDEAVPQLVPGADLVLTSNDTSAAVDAYVGGGRILVYDDCRGVNFSPLRHIQGVTFVHNALDLATAIDKLWEGEGDHTHHQAREFFNIDTRLALWRRYFGLTKPAHEENAEDELKYANRER